MRGVCPSCRWELSLWRVVGRRQVTCDRCGVALVRHVKHRWLALLVSWGAAAGVKFWFETHTTDLIAGLLAMGALLVFLGAFGAVLAEYRLAPPRDSS